MVWCRTGFRSYFPISLQLLLLGCRQGINIPNFHLAAFMYKNFRRIRKANYFLAFHVSSILSSVFPLVSGTHFHIKNAANKPIKP